MKILFLSPWYPHRYDAMSGLFVRKHAQAVARRGGEVTVMCRVFTDEVEQDEIVEEIVEGVREIILYTSQRGFLAELRGVWELWEYWHERYGVPDVVHVNVLTKQGLVAWWLKRHYGVPYVVMEHWSGYLPENGDYRGIFRRRLSEMILRDASAVMPVSVRLMNAMKQCGLEHDNWQIVPNVIDDFFFETRDARHETRDAIHETRGVRRFRFLHVSCFDNRAKNTLGIVEAVERLSQQRDDFEMIMVGTGQDVFFTRSLADNYRLGSRGFMKFTGEQTPQLVKEWMDASDCFVLFSNYETAAVVLEEAAACGQPIISTPVGIAEELQITDYRLQITDETCGFCVPVGDVDALTEAMSAMIDSADKFDKEKIKAKATQYSFENVGRQLVDIYRNCF